MLAIAAPDMDTGSSTHVIRGTKRTIDVDRLGTALSDLDLEEVRERRKTYLRILHEARMLAGGKGISFTQMLVLLAHYKLIDDDEALM